MPSGPIAGSASLPDAAPPEEPPAEPPGALTATLRALEDKRYDEAAREVERAIPRLEGLYARTIGQVLLARATEGLGDAKRADRAYGQVIVLATSASPAEMAGLATAERASVLGARAEAHYHYGEVRRAAARALRMPHYTGPGGAKSIDAFVKTKVKDWLEARRVQVEAAVAEYLKIDAVGAIVPARWRVAAAARTGGMWAAFADETTTSPIPREWDLPGDVPGIDPPIAWAEMRSAYFAALDEALQPTRDRARSAYEACVRIAEAARIEGTDRAECSGWLAKHPR